MTALAPTDQSTPLPKLRDDLELIDIHTSASGAASRLIYDPLRHRYIRIDRGTFELLSILNECRNSDELKNRAWNAFSHSVDDETLDRLTDFLERSELTDHAHDGDWRKLAKRRALSRRKVASRATHSYLFFKIPILRPQRFLESTLHIARPLMSKTAIIIIFVAGVVGLYLVSRQWDTFLTTFHHAFTLNGIVTFAVALGLVKALHELGHAYVAVSYGCRVSSLGVAFMLLTPMLYTDVTDAWRLKNNRQRLHIDAAGVLVELALAAIATLLWAFLPESPAKSVAFAIATVSWIMSVAFNLNPFMRFDGYYILSDLLQVENLQTRAFALARWNLREVLFDLKAPRPEVFTPKMHAVLIAYAWGTWIYRLILFIGIALLVYTMFFKALGTVLCVVEIAFFIALPIWSEIKEWIAMRKSILTRRRTYVSATILAGLIAVLALPWSTRVEVPALLTAEDVKQIYPVRPGRIVKVLKQQGDHVEADEPLVELQAPDINSQLDLTRVRIQMVQMRLSRRTADDLDRAQSLVLERELMSLKTKAAGLEKETSRLRIRAPTAGTVIELNPNIHPGRWIGGRERIALIGSRQQWMLNGYISETDIDRLSVGASGKFIPDDPILATRDVTLISVLRAGASVLEYPDLASVHAGPIAARYDADGGMVPVSAQFLATMRTSTTSEPLPHTVRGVVHLSGTPQSILARIWRQVLAVLVRESGA